jgi:hypothetical protein
MYRMSQVYYTGQLEWLSPEPFITARLIAQDHVRVVQQRCRSRATFSPGQPRWFRQWPLCSPVDLHNPDDDDSVRRKNAAV